MGIGLRVDDLPAVAAVLLRHVGADVLTGGTAPAGVQFRGARPFYGASQVQDVVALLAAPDFVRAAEFLAADQALEHASGDHLFQSLSLRTRVH